MRVLVPYRSEEKVQPYLAALRRAGLDPVPRDVNRPGTLDGAAGLLLTGGTDVDPRLYGQTAQAETDFPDSGRDSAEMALLNEALNFDVPVLAICRGVQLLNVAQGGTLVQHLDSPRHDPELEDRGAAAHQVQVLPDNLLSEAVQFSEIGVNSRHHQAVARTGSGLRVCAVDPLDNVVEALDYPEKRWVLGVQWHPEDQTESPHAIHLFAAFAQAVTA